jgi:hypothetical protein
MTIIYSLNTRKLLKTLSSKIFQGRIILKIPDFIANSNTYRIIR